MAELYSDPLLTISDEGLRIRRVYLSGRDQTIRWDEINKVRAILPTVWNGRYRIFGTGNFRTWFGWDSARPTRETIFIIHRHGQWSRIGFTVDDAKRVKEILKERGLLQDDQGDAAPTPLPPETRPMWRWFSLHAFTLLLLALIAQTIYFYPRLPERVATHFNAAGKPDSFGDKTTFAATMVIIPALVWCLLVAISYVLGRTKAALVGRYTLWIGAATLAFVLVIAHLAYRANLTPGGSLGLTPLLLTALFLAAVAGIVTRMLWRLA